MKTKNKKSKSNASMKKMKKMKKMTTKSTKPTPASKPVANKPTPASKSSSKTLIIVESPGKITTIQKICDEIQKGKYEVIASKGHIADIPHNTKWIDEEVAKNGEIAINYEPLEDKSEEIKTIQTRSKGKQVIIATDDDREGELIGFNILGLLNLPPKTNPRILFNEITASAIRNALQTPKTINMNLVNAAQLRKLVDILYGYKISNVIRKHISGSLTAGRCQSPAVKLCIEREKEIENFSVSHSFDVTADIKHKSVVCSVKRSEPLEFGVEDHDKIQGWLKSVSSKKLVLNTIKERIASEGPRQPFITSSLQQEAYHKHHFSPKETMSIAQKLYEGGYITYMRTDSTNLSSTIVKEIHDWLKDDCGQEVQARSFGKKSGHAQEAHEAIRPTHIKLSKPMPSDSKQKKLYTLIWVRTVQSQMENAQAKITEASFSLQDPKVDKASYLAETKHYIKEGWTQLNNLPTNLKQLHEWRPKVKSGSGGGGSGGSGGGGSESDSNTGPESFLKNLELKSIWDIQIMEVFEKLKKPPSRYTQADLVRVLESEGIGRPSTYSTIISKIQEKEYVIVGDAPHENKTLYRFKFDASKKPASKQIEKTTKEDTIGGQKNVFNVTETGRRINAFLEEQFPVLMDLKFTNLLEEDLDKITDGKNDWNKIVRKFHGDLAKMIKGITVEPQKGEFLHIISKNAKETIGTTFTRKGIALAWDKEGEKRKYTSLPCGFDQTNMSKLTKKDVLEAFDYPRVLGKHKGDEVVVHKGPFGLYVVYNEKNYSLNLKCAEGDGKITDKKMFDLAVETIKKKDASMLKEYMASEENGNLSIRIGKTGNYIMQRKGKFVRFAPFPEKANVNKFTEADCIKELDAHQAKPKFGRKKKT